MNLLVAPLGVAHPEAELKKRLISGVNAPKHEMRETWKRLCDRDMITISSVREEAVLGIVQILGPMGAEVDLDIEFSSYTRALSKWPKR